MPCLKTEFALVASSPFGRPSYHGKSSLHFCITLFLGKLPALPFEKDIVEFPPSHVIYLSRRRKKSRLFLLDFLKQQVDPILFLGRSG